MEILAIPKRKHRRKMEEPKRLTPEEARIKEINPLADLTNTIPSSLPSTQSSSSSPYSTQSLFREPPLKNPISNNSSISNSKLTSVESTPNNKKKKEKGKRRGKIQINKENTSSMMSPLPKTASVPGSGVRSEFCSIYSRKSKRKEVAEPLSYFRVRKDEDGDNGLSKSCPLPHKKKQQWKKAEENASKHDLPQDFIEKQRAYFAEIDAFELEEEEVESSDDE